MRPASDVAQPKRAEPTRHPMEEEIERWDGLY
jgi:hypothetical protein